MPALEQFYENEFFGIQSVRNKVECAFNYRKPDSVDSLKIELSINPFVEQSLSHFGSLGVEQHTFWPYSSFFVKYRTQETNSVFFLTNDDGRSISKVEVDREIDKVTKIEELGNLKVKSIVTAEDYAVVVTDKEELLWWGQKIYNFTLGIKYKMKIDCPKGEIKAIKASVNYLILFMDDHSLYC
jgi:hypothetical protein